MASIKKNLTKKSTAATKKNTNSECCHQPEFPDHSKEISRINRINGQLEAVKRMIEDRRYCPEIMIQLKSVYAATKSLESAILEKHLQSCVADAFNSKDPKESKLKIQELVNLFNRV